jgi:hypothetical protein
MLKTVSSIANAIGALNYKGTWNASTNTPTLASGVGTKGDYYQVSVAGSTSLDGLSNWGVGDVAAFNGTTWQRIEGGADLNGVNLSVSGNSTLGDATADSVNMGNGDVVKDTSGNFLIGVNGVTPVTSVAAPHFVAGRGTASRAGVAGLFSGNCFNINWTGTPDLWIDSTNIGVISTTSDYRVKRDVEQMQDGALARVMTMRPVTYKMADFGKLFKSDDAVREGFIAHEIGAVIPSGVIGEKDAEGQIQSLKLDAIVAVLTKALQELKTEFDAYKASHP